MYWARPRNYYTPDISICKYQYLNYPTSIILINARVFYVFTIIIIIIIIIITEDKR